jgi:hypothetical protein
MWGYSAVALGAISQFRMMGSAVGVAITTSVLNNYVKDHLKGFLSAEKIRELLLKTQMIGDFDPVVGNEIRGVFVKGYNVQLRIVVGICVAQVLSVGLMWRRKNVVV